MNSQNRPRIAATAPTRARAIAAKSETEPSARCLEISFLITAMLVFMVMTGLLAGF